MWARLSVEQPLNVNVSDAELAGELAIPWKYFVLFVSIDRNKLATQATEQSTHGHAAHALQTAIERKQYRGDQLDFFIACPELPQILGRVVCAFANKVDEVESVTWTGIAVCCVGHSLDPSMPNTIKTSTAGFRFMFGGNRHFAATSLHGEFNAARQHIQQSPVRRAVLLADAFATGDENLATASEIGHVFSDVRNDFVDVGLIQLRGLGNTPMQLWYSEDDVVVYMKDEMKASYTNTNGARVLIHSPLCFLEGQGDGPMPGAVIEVKNFISTDRSYNWHFTVQLADGYEVKPGQSGSAVTLADSGRPMGMLVGHYRDDSSIAIVTPLHHIYASLNDALRLTLSPDSGPLRLCWFAFPASRRAALSFTVPSLHNRIVEGRVICGLTQQPYRLNISPAVNGSRQEECCPYHRPRQRAGQRHDRPRPETRRR